MDNDDSPSNRTERWRASTRPANAGAAAAEPSVFDAVEPRFDEQGELGRGGMGRVAEAVDRALERTVAIKYSLASDEVGRARFEREVRITARLEHPAIVPVLDAGRDANGRPFYVMRKIDGVPLGERVAAAAGVRERLALVPALLTAVDAAAYAHARGIVHRDIKPANILLGAFGETLLIDWGLARTVGGAPSAATASGGDERDTGLTQLGSAFGTPGFMAPEQARGEPAGPAADVYSLGATLYYVLAGAPPFEGTPATQAIERAAAGETPDLARIPPEVPVELTAITGKALAAAVAERYRDAGEMAGDLRRFLAGQLVEAHRYTVRQRIARWIRAHRLVAIVVAAALIVLVAGGALSIQQIVAERNLARDARGVAEARAGELLVDRARALVASDPTSAVAVLRELPASSPLWPTAREIVRAAAAGGTERWLGRHKRFVQAIAWAPDGRLASVSAAGALQVYDAAGAARVVGRCDTSRLIWLDEHVVVCAYANHDVNGMRHVLTLVDIDLQTAKSLPAGAFAEIAVDGSRVVVRSADGGVQRFTAAGEASTLADGGIEAIAARAGRIAMLSRDRLTVIDRDGTRRELAVAVTTRIFRLALSASGRRAAALVWKGVIEWDLDGRSNGAAAPRTWPRTADARNGIVYAGEQLYGWSSDGTGVAALEPGRVTTHWLMPLQSDEGVEVAETEDGAVFATGSGHLAFAGAAGIVEIPHRPLPIRVIAARGRRLAIGTREGEVVALDLSAALPQIVPLEPRERLYAVDAGHIVVGREADATFADDPPAVPGAGSAQPDSLAIVDLATGARTPLASLGFGTAASLVGDAVIAWGGSDHRALAIWDLAGHPRYRADGIRSVAIGAGGTRGTCAYFNDAAGDVLEVPIADPTGARPITHIAPRRIAGRDEAPFVRLIAEAGRLIVTRIADGSKDAETQVIDASGARPLALGVPGIPNSVHRSSDGTWWVVTDDARLWQTPPGSPPREIEPGQQIRALHASGDRIWAESTATLYEIALDGRVLRRTSNVGAVHAIDDGALLATPEGVAVITPLANVRRLLRLPAQPLSVFATRDGRVVAAMIPLLGGGRGVAVWRDPVPAAPGELAAYLPQLSNARLAPGSDELAWDPP